MIGSCFLCQVEILMKSPRKQCDSIRANTAHTFLFIEFKILKLSFQKFSCECVKISLIHLAFQTCNDNEKLCNSIRHRAKAETEVVFTSF